MNLRTVVGAYGSPGLSLSVPIEIVRQIADELASKGRVKRPRLGAGFEDVSPLAAVAAGRAYASGALINAVAVDGLAAQMGLRVTDIVVGMNGRAIGDSADMARALLGWRSAEGTTITVYREGRYQQLRLGRRHPDSAGDP
jgi:serine protease Do